MIVHTVAQHLQSVYQLEGLPPVEQFLVDAPTLRRLRGDVPAGEKEPPEILLVRYMEAELEVALFLAPAIVALLAQDNPFHRLHAGNIGSFCVVVEGISHFCCLCWKFLHGMPVSQLELEIQAEVDKFLCCAWLQHCQQARAAPLPLQEHLFVRYQIRAGCTTEQAGRYHQASTMAAQFCHALHTQFLTARRLGALHQLLPPFYRLSHWGKLRLLA